MVLPEVSLLCPKIHAKFQSHSITMDRFYPTFCQRIVERKKGSQLISEWNTNDVIAQMQKQSYKPSLLWKSQMLVDSKSDHESKIHKEHKLPIFDYGSIYVQSYSCLLINEWDNYAFSWPHLLFSNSNPLLHTCSKICSFQCFNWLSKLPVMSLAAKFLEPTLLLRL